MKIFGFDLKHCCIFRNPKRRRPKNKSDNNLSIDNIFILEKIKKLRILF